MKLYKIFIVIVFITCIYFLIIEKLIKKPNKSIKNNDIKTNFDLKIKYTKHNFNSKSNFSIFDQNELNFDDLIDKYCNVQQIRNVSRRCLLKLDKYNLNKLHVDLVSEESRPIYYHTFWQPNTVKSHHLRVMSLNILSYLATQDLTRTKYIVWTVDSLKLFSEAKKQFEKYIDKGVLEFRILDMNALCSTGVFLLRQQICLQRNDGDVILYSDFVRFLVLYSYGGIYVDGDVIFLRDMKPFWNKNFVYRWSFTESYNTAVMGIRYGHGYFVEKIYNKIVLSPTGPTLVSRFYPSKVKEIVAEMNNNNFYNYTDFEVFSSVLFDPAWLCFDVHDDIELPNTICRFPDFYDEVVSTEKFFGSGGRFFPGAFTHHLHLGSCGSCQIRNDSYFFHVESYFKSRLV
jgi:hypothetical protein